MIKKSVDCGGKHEKGGIHWSSAGGDKERDAEGLCARGVQSHHQQNAGRSETARKEFAQAVTALRKEKPANLAVP